ncbi:hypothetical protein Pfo_022906 [Paulownia fortunei]|nr:hypothetical protein Pfo_022906 [Paulownia fortunei]
MLSLWGKKMQLIAEMMPATRVLKKKKLKIIVHRPVGTRVVFDDEGNTLPPLAKLADTKTGSDTVKLDKDKVKQRYAELREEMKVVDKEDEALDHQRRKEKHIRQKMKWKRGREEEDGDAVSEDLSGSERETTTGRLNQNSKIYLESDSDDDERRKGEDNTGMSTTAVTLAEQEELALKLLSSMHS